MEDNNIKEQTVALADRINDEPEKARQSTFWSEITLEPMWFGLLVSTGFDLVVLKNLYIQRACLVDLGYSKDVCYVEESLNATVEIAAQKIVSAASVSSGMVSGAITIILVIFLGPWSDASGRRKPLMLMSIGSTVVSSLTTLIVLALPQLSVMWVIYMKTIPMALGSMNFLVLSAYSYLGDVCYETLRTATVVMGRNGIAMNISLMFGSCFGPIVYRALGFEGIATISFILQLTSFLYVYLKVKDFHVKEKIPSIFDITLPLKGFKCLFRKRDGYKRQILITMLFIPTTGMLMAAILLAACTDGFINLCTGFLVKESSSVFGESTMLLKRVHYNHDISDEVAIRYLYLRNTFSWTASEYGMLLSIRQIVNSIGIMAMVTILKKKLKMRDEVIGVIGAISELTDAIIFMFISESWILFAITIFGILGSGPIIVERPIINKHIQQDEQGQIYSVMSILEMTIFSSFLPFSNYVYSKTLSWFPSCFILITAAGAVVQLACYCLVIKLSKKETLRVQRLAQDFPKD